MPTTDRGTHKKKDSHSTTRKHTTEDDDAWLYFADRNLTTRTILDGGFSNSILIDVESWQGEEDLPSKVADDISYAFGLSGDGLEVFNEKSKTVFRNELRESLKWGSDQDLLIIISGFLNLEEEWISYSQDSPSSNNTKNDKNKDAAKKEDAGQKDKEAKKKEQLEKQTKILTSLESWKIVCQLINTLEEAYSEGIKLHEDHMPGVAIVVEGGLPNVSGDSEGKSFAHKALNWHTDRLGWEDWDEDWEHEDGDW